MNIQGVRLKADDKRVNEHLLSAAFQRVILVFVGSGYVVQIKYNERTP